MESQVNTFFLEGQKNLVWIAIGKQRNADNLQDIFSEDIRGIVK